MRAVALFADVVSLVVASVAAGPSHVTTHGLLKWSSVAFGDAIAHWPVGEAVALGYGLACGIPVILLARTAIGRRWPRIARVICTGAMAGLAVWLNLWVWMIGALAFGWVLTRTWLPGPPEAQASVVQR